MKKQSGLLEVPTAGKPFLKWAGGKGQLLEAISQKLPCMENIDTYIEPFAGSGAVMFWILNNCPGVKQVVINDINRDLINTYEVIKNSVDELINELEDLDRSYKSVTDLDKRAEFYYSKRDEYNSRNYQGVSVRFAALFIFLNRTCFNGLYRVNSKNLFNVPFGKYANPTICDKDLLIADSRLLQKVTILNGNYSQTIQYAGSNSFFYFDPPYKPISKTSSFNSYSSDVFNDRQQSLLKAFCDELQLLHVKFMLSNSDPKSGEENDSFFDELYRDYHIRRVDARRNINSKGGSRGCIKELLITNY